MEFGLFYYFSLWYTSIDSVANVLIIDYFSFILWDKIWDRDKMTKLTLNISQHLFIQIFNSVLFFFFHFFSFFFSLFLSFFFSYFLFLILFSVLTLPGHGVITSAALPRPPCVRQSYHRLHRHQYWTPILLLLFSIISSLYRAIHL